MAKTDFNPDSLDKTDLLELNQIVESAANYKTQAKLAGEGAKEQAKIAKEKFGIPTTDFNTLVRNRNEKDVDEKASHQVELASLEERLYDAGKANQTAMG